MTVWKDEIGFWAVDENDELGGPFDTEEDAKRWYDGWPERADSGPKLRRE